MARLALLLAALVLPAGAAAGAEEPPCALCRPGEAAASAEQPLSIAIDSGLTFSRLALIGQGEASAEIDAQTGRKRVGGGMIDLGGAAVQGHARITGAPGRAVRVTCPGSVAMTSQGGGTAELTDFTTDLPPWPVLDSSGSLEFSFGGSLVLRGTVSGALRGRIPISVDYN